MRQIRDAKLDTRNARAKLKQRREPYWRAISGGLAIGYRKGATGGTWIAKHYAAEHGRRYEALGAADDIRDADGENVLDFQQAESRAREWLAKLTKQDTGDVTVDAGSYTVADAMDAYLRFLESEGRSKYSIRDTRYRDQAFIRPKLGDVKLSALTSDQLRRWRDELANAAARIRTRAGDTQKHRTSNDSQDVHRARRATANRTWAILRVALNQAFRDGRVHSDSVWRKVKPFQKVGAARVRYLTVAEARRLINASDPDFRLLVQAALQTGCRYGELTRLKVQDFSPDAGTISIRQSKSGKPRHVVLTDEGMALFRQVCAGRSGSEPILRKATSGEPWDKSHQRDPMCEAVARAKINPPISFHGLRHTWASLAVMNGVPLMVVARNLGHADTSMVEQHYGHLAPSYVAEAIRKGAPRFGFKPGKVAALP